MPYASHNPKGSIILLILRRLRFIKVQGLPLSPWLVRGRAWILTLVVCLQAPSLPHCTMVPLGGRGMMSEHTLLPSYLATWRTPLEPICNRVASHLLAHPTFRYAPVLQKDPSSRCSFAAGTAGNGKSGRQPFHSLRCQQKSGLCEGPRK